MLATCWSSIQLRFFYAHNFTKLLCNSGSFWVIFQTSSKTTDLNQLVIIDELPNILIVKSQLRQFVFAELHFLIGSFILFLNGIGRKHISWCFIVFVLLILEVWIRSWIEVSLFSAPTSLFYLKLINIMNTYHQKNILIRKNVSRMNYLNMKLGNHLFKH